MEVQYDTMQHFTDDSLALQDWGWKTSYMLDEAVCEFAEDIRWAEHSDEEEEP